MRWCRGGEREAREGEDAGSCGEQRGEQRGEAEAGPGEVVVEEDLHEGARRLHAAQREGDAGERASPVASGGKQRVRRHQGRSRGGGGGEEEG